MESISQVVRIRTPEAEAEVQERLTSVFGARNGRAVATADGWNTTRFGSRLAFRAWGLWGRGGERRLPIIARTRIDRDGDRVVLDVELTSDEGWYAFRLPAVEQAYRRVFREILGALESLPE